MTNSQEEFIDRIEYESSSNQLTDNILTCFSNNWTIFTQLYTIKATLSFKQTVEYSFQNKFIDFELNKLFNLIFDSENKQIILNGDQRTEEIFLEIGRIKRLINYFKIRNEILLDFEYKDVKDVRALI